MRTHSRCHPVLLVAVSVLTLAVACDGGGGADAGDTTASGADASAGDGAVPAGDVTSPDGAAGDAPAVEDVAPLPPAPPGPCTLTNRDPGTGAVRAVLRYVWDGDRIDHIDVDEGGDGSIDDRWEYEYREDGSMSRRDGVGYPTNPYDARYVIADDGSSFETHVDRDGDGEDDEVWVAYYDDEGRTVRIEFGDYFVLVYSDFDEWDNATRSERLVPPDDELSSACTATWRGPRELLHEECVDANGDVTLRTTVTWEADRRVLSVTEVPEGLPGAPLTERYRWTFAYDERGWLSVEVRMDAQGPDHELTYDHDCWLEQDGLAAP